MHFSFLPFWLMKSGLWLGALYVLNTASPVIQYLLQILQYTAAASPALQRSSTTTSLFGFILMFCYQMNSFLALRSVMGQCKEKRDYISCCFFLKKCSKLQKCTAGKRVFGVRVHFDTEQCRCIHTYSWCFQHTPRDVWLLIPNFKKGCRDG